MADVAKHVSAIDDGPLPEPQIQRDAGDAATFKDAIRDAKQTVASRSDTLKWIMGEEKGRKFIFEELAKCHILRNPFRTDPLSTAFECGEMNIGQQLFVDLQAACPELYTQMMEEAKENHYG